MDDYFLSYPLPPKTCWRRGFPDQVVFAWRLPVEQGGPLYAPSYKTQLHRHRGIIGQ